MIFETLAIRQWRAVISKEPETKEVGAKTDYSSLLSGESFQVETQGLETRWNSDCPSWEMALRAQGKQAG